MKPHPRLIRCASQSGSAVLAALSILAVTAVVVGVALSEARNRFHTSHHSQHWTQAQHAAEAGVELALMSAQKATWTADGWPAAPGDASAAPVSKTFALSTGVPAGGPVSATVAVDKVTLSGSDWLRIRSTGQAEVFGGAVAGQDTQDVLLRKLSLRHDRRTGQSVGTPRATRTVEILAEPTQRRPFQFTIVSKQLFDIHANTTADSYDSSDSTKSNFTPFTTYGIYDAAKRLTNGDVATLDTAQWNFNSAHIWGDVYSPANNLANATNIHGDKTGGFTFDFPTEVSPAWTTVTTNHGTVTNVSKTFTGGTQTAPTRHKFTSIELTGADKNILVNNPTGETESWAEIWVEGDVTIAAASQTGIKIAPGVHATFHFGGKVEIVGGSGGYALSNESKLPENLIIRAYGGSSGATKDFILAYTDFWGVVSAPWYKVKFDMTGKHVHGSFLAWQFDASDGTNLHYDEALADLGIGEFSVWKVASWVEAVR